VTTNLSCTDPDVCTTPQKFGDEAAPVLHCEPGELLPCFLKFTEYTVPREDNSNMKCKVIMRKPKQQAQQDCSGSGPQRLGAQADSLPETATDRWIARWDIDPAYYQYQACECLLVRLGSVCWQGLQGCLCCQQCVRGHVNSFPAWLAKGVCPASSVMNCLNSVADWTMAPCCDTLHKEPQHPQKKGDRFCRGQHHSA